MRGNAQVYVGHGHWKAIAGNSWDSALVTSGSCPVTKLVAATKTTPAKWAEVHARGHSPHAGQAPLDVDRDGELPA